VCEHAYASSRRHVLARADELEEKLARRGLRLRRDVLADETRTLFGSSAEGAAPPGSAREVVTDIRATLERLDAALDRLQKAG
jgi:hypothetical protein